MILLAALLFFPSPVCKSAFYWRLFIFKQPSTHQRSIGDGREGGNVMRVTMMKSAWFHFLPPHLPRPFPFLHIVPRSTQFRTMVISLLPYVSLWPPSWWPLSIRTLWKRWQRSLKTAKASTPVWGHTLPSGTVQHHYTCSFFLGVEGDWMKQNARKEKKDELQYRLGSCLHFSCNSNCLIVYSLLHVRWILSHITVLLLCVAYCK